MDKLFTLKCKARNMEPELDNAFLQISQLYGEDAARVAVEWQNAVDEVAEIWGPDAVLVRPSALPTRDAIEQVHEALEELLWRQRWGT